MSMHPFGKMPCGKGIEEYILKNDLFEVNVITLGASMRRLLIAGCDIIGGYDTLAEYVTDDDPYQGAIVGRYANRIKGGKITLNGKEYQLSINQNGNHLHGGKTGFCRRVWQCKEASDTSLTLSYLSPDGEEGYPGNLFTEVTYTLADNCLMIEFRAKADKATPVNLTAHPFFHLGGIGNGDVLDHTAEIYADHYTEVDETLAPTGNRLSVAGTPLDFRTKKSFRRDLAATCEGNGFDQNLIFSPALPKERVCGRLLPRVATFAGERVKMDVFTDAPGAQLYTGNYLGGPLLFKGAIPKIKHGAFCFEPQSEPDGINHGVPPLAAGEVYTSTIVYRFE